MPMMGSECGGTERSGRRPDPALASIVDRVFASLADGAPPPHAADEQAERAIRIPVLMPPRLSRVTAPSWAAADEDTSVRVLVPG
ncbi:MAG TPA: hypothetical protein VF665_06865 [Longimicrobium sp.]|jgi:hypothetical protein|uniref:hypothetical protein n=1 Tax=Longimicrobium sp. TaxID=2029185 RepID=UPI002EDB1A09